MKQIKSLSADYIRTRSLAALDKAIDIIGSRYKLAKLIGAADTTVKRWQTLTSYGIAAAYVLEIEVITEGEVKRYDLRCDIYPDGDRYSNSIKAIAKSLLKEHKIANMKDLHYKMQAFAVGVSNKIYEDKIFEIFKIPFILKTTHHADAYKYAIFNENYESIFNLHEEGKAFFAIQCDIIDKIYSILEHK